MKGKMKVKLFLAAALGMAVTPCVMLAQAPAGSTGKCNDGTYTTATTKSGACKGHKGIATWNGPTTNKGATTSSTTSAAPATTATTAPAAKPATPAATPAPAASSTPSKPAASKTTATKTAAPGGGPGLVWVNTSSKVYHCYGSESYGTTKAGKYMSEADAKTAGAHAARGQACSK
jgi:hypothetical protein